MPRPARTDRADHSTRATRSDRPTASEPAMTAAWLAEAIPAELLPWPVVRVGYGGRGAGPDIRGVTVRLPSGAVATGDVEIHRLASDFARHGHASDPAYARTLLHLVWRDDRGAPGASVPLANGGASPTLALEPVLGTAAVLEALTASALRNDRPALPPCAALPGPAATALVRDEGLRRIAERAWRARDLAASGWEAAWDRLLRRAVLRSAGRGATTAEAIDRLATAITTSLGTDPVRALALAARDARPARLVAVLRGGAGDAGIGPHRAAEVGWNAALPLLAALASAYGDPALGAAVARLITAWPAPAPYGRTRALAEVLASSADGSALHAQGLLRLQELWCERGGCGSCPLSSVRAPSLSAKPDGAGAASRWG